MRIKITARHWIVGFLGFPQMLIILHFYFKYGWREAALVMIAIGLECIGNIIMQWGKN